VAAGFLQSANTQQRYKAGSDTEQEWQSGYQQHQRYRTGAKRIFVTVRIPA
jgi:hypothetical protein